MEGVNENKLLLLNDNLTIDQINHLHFSHKSMQFCIYYTLICKI